MERSGLKRLCLRLALFLPVVLAIVAVNYAVDPAHLFGKGQAYEAGVARLLLAGSNVANLADYDDRSLLKVYVRGLTRPPDVLVFGSSRVLQISSHHFSGPNMFNAGLAGAVMEDLIGAYELFAQRRLVPARVFIGLDPWMFNAHHGQTRWKTIEREYRAGLSRIGLASRFDLASPGPLEDGSPGKWQELVSLPYFQESLRQLPKWFEAGKRSADYSATTAEAGERAIKRFDGALVYAAGARNRSPEAVRALALDYVRPKGVYLLNRFRKLDEGSCRKLEAWVGRLQADGVAVTFLLAPYHPLVYEHLAADGRLRIIAEVERYLSAVARSRSIAILGSYDPAGAGCGEGEFYDGMHPTEACVGKILRRQRLDR